MSNNNKDLDIRGNLYLSNEEKILLDKLCAKMGVSRMKLINFLIKYFLNNYRDINLFERMFENE